jgi:hypothetical protein
MDRGYAICGCLKVYKGVDHNPETCLNIESNRRRLRESLSKSVCIWCRNVYEEPDGETLTECPTCGKLLTRS